MSILLTRSFNYSGVYGLSMDWDSQHASKSQILREVTYSVIKEHLFTTSTSDILSSSDQLLLEVNVLLNAFINRKWTFKKLLSILLNILWFNNKTPWNQNSCWQLAKSTKLKGSDAAIRTAARYSCGKLKHRQIFKLFMATISLKNSHPMIQT